jgi:hypothetical protein
MTLKQFRFCLVTLALWPVSILFSGRMQGIVGSSLWWLLRHSGGTQLSPPTFINNASLPLAVVDGFVLGLIPLVSLWEWVLSTFAVLRVPSGRMRERLTEKPTPVTWSWVLPLLAFAARWIRFDTHADVSVFGVVNHPVSRFAYFFGSQNLRPAETNPFTWYIDRVLVTVPLLFVLGYRFGDWIRPHLPRRPLAELEPHEEVPAPASTDTPGS